MKMWNAKFTQIFAVCLSLRQKRDNRQWNKVLPCAASVFSCPILYTGVRAVLFGLALNAPPQVLGTPLIALREANNCQGCHTPGRAQRPVLWRRCTLDCQGCHVDPSGAGPRNQWGTYYANDQMAAINLIKPKDPLSDKSFFDLHYDARYIQRETTGVSRSFPMATELSLRVRPLIRWLHFTYQKLYLGRVDAAKLNQSSSMRGVTERYHAMIDELPFNTYVKIGRGLPLYGLRQPNHSKWIRERIGLDEFKSVDAITVGGTPNVPYIHVSKILGSPSEKEEDEQKGMSFHGGLRGVSYAWHINTSYWKTQSKKAFIDMNSVGAGANIFGVILYGERNWRRVLNQELSRSEKEALQSTAIKLHPTSTISDYTVAFSQVKGLLIGYNYEELKDTTLHSFRKSYFLNIHPIPYLQIDLLRRFETGSRRLSDTLLIVHMTGDF